VCGDAAIMARDVHAAIRRVIQQHSGRFLSEAEAEEYLLQLKQRQRYVLDVWA
jgi:sulfite reductase (NADPH) flavoprotein alpha-component